MSESLGKSVLIAEDNESIMYLLRYLLEREGFTVLAAPDGRAAELAIGKQPPPSMAILDIMLPFVDGHELLRRIRANEAWKNVPVIMLTAKSQESDIVKALDAGANDYVIKPFKPDELLARIRRVMRTSA